MNGTMYIQYFCMKLFSGSGVTTWPSGVRGGGERSSGLELRSIRFQIIHTFDNLSPPRANQNARNGSGWLGKYSQDVK